MGGERSVSGEKMQPPCMRAESGDNKNGFRMCVSHAHDGSELRNGSVLVDVLFIDVDVHDAKSTTACMAKYMTSDSVEINASATVLDNAAGHNRGHPSTADDKDVPERS